MWGSHGGGPRRPSSSKSHKPITRGRRLPFQLATGYEKKHTLRYIAGPPAALRGTQPSQAIMLVKPSASGAKAAPAPVMQTNCRASVFSGRQRGYGVMR